MIALLISTLIASLIGSGHCAGMCGPFAMIANNPALGKKGDSDVNLRSYFSLSFFYNVGRLMTYLVFGLIAGALGMAINFSGEQIGLQRAAIIFAGSTLILFGLIGLLRNFGVSFFQLGFSQRILRGLQSVIRSTNVWLPSYRAFAIGLLTSLMPCGWLYFFVIAASSTQSLVYAPAVMFFFWLGTTPVLASLGVSSGALMKKLRARANWIIPILMLAIGIYSVSSRTPVELANQFADPEVNSVTNTIYSAKSHESPCCKNDDN